MFNLSRGIAALLLAVLLIPLLPAGAGAADDILFTEDFEHEWPGTLPHGWIRYDRDDGADIDYWCRTRYRSVSSDHSAWCAVIGFNSMYQNAWNKNVTRLEDPLARYQPEDYVLRYDLEMDAFMARPVPNTERYTSLAVSFYYWSEVGRAGTAVGDDHLYLTVANTTEFPEKAEETVVWKQPTVSTASWTKVTVGLPAGSTWLIFNFRSGSAVPAGGPYIGTFIDDIALAGRSDGLDAMGAAPLTAHAAVSGAGGEGWFSTDVTVILNGEGGSGARTLRYRLDGGPWTAYGGAFVVTADGEHTVEATASDTSGNIAPVSSTSFAIDREPPAIGLVGNLTVAPEAPWVSFRAADNGSGMSSVDATLDGAAVQGIELASGTIPVSGAAGEHVLVVVATDRAGNTASVESVVVISQPPAPPLPGLLLPVVGIGALAAGAITVVVRRRR